jgi:hypothetical protein
MEESVLCKVKVSWERLGFLEQQLSLVAHHFRNYAPEDVPYSKKRVYSFDTV